MLKLTTPRLIFITPVFIWLSHYLAVFPHEFAHSFAAWSVGEMKNPFAIDYGGTSWRNILLLWDIDENVEYQRIFAEGHGVRAAFAAFAGMGIGTGLMFVLGAFLLSNRKVQEYHWLYYFVFWFQLMNLGNFYDYVPIRVFSTHGDMGNTTRGLDISPWWLFVIIGYGVALLMFRFFSRTVPLMLANLSIVNTNVQAYIITLCVFLLFGWFGGIFGALFSPDPMHHGEVSHFLEIASFTAIPGILFILWPTRPWFRRQLTLTKK